jgi:hypothetical protein
MNTNITYVTALYDIQTPDTRSHSSFTQRLKYLEELFLLNIQIVAFIDPSYKEFIDSSLYPNVTFIYRELNSFFIYSELTRSNLNLPGSRNTGKDTKEFLSLMNTKIEFVKEAMSFCETEYIAWIDGSIYHIVNNKEKVKEGLEKRWTRDVNVCIPGPNRISENETPFDSLAYRIHWIYCGGFFVCKRGYVEEFYRKTIEVLNTWKEKNCLTWEVNIWIDIEQKNRSTIFWVYGDHNDSMLLINE